MKKLLGLILSVTAFVVSAVDYSGTYKCDLYDKTDGGFITVLRLKLNPKSSMPEDGYSSYDVYFNVNGIPYPYTGIAAANGNNLAIYFESTGSKKNPDDRGVGIATVLLDKDKSGKDVTTLHKFYYEKSYKGNSNYGFEDCRKVS